MRACTNPVRRMDSLSAAVFSSTMVDGYSVKMHDNGHRLDRSAMIHEWNVFRALPLVHDAEEIHGSVVLKTTP
jgi:hypothetical protein